MSRPAAFYGRFAPDPCGNVPAPQTWCKRCFRRYTTKAKELAMKFSCPDCLARQEALRAEGSS